MKDVVDYMTGKEGYRIIAGSIAIDGQEEEEKIYKFPYMRRIKRKTFSDEKTFNAIIKNWEDI